MIRLLVCLVSLLSLQGCAHRADEKAPDPATVTVTPHTTLTLFSANPAGGLPRNWAPLSILRHKKQTHYQLVTDQNKTVLHASASESSSALMHELGIEPYGQPWLQWRWKIAELLEAADNTQRATEDSPVRIILGFDGDKEALPFADQILFDTAKLVTGHDFPYATLMYIWENKAPVGTVIRSPHSGRIKMMVVASGPEGVGTWREFTRNIVEDFEQAFGEKPGKLLGVGVLTDTDNTRDSVEAWYGDIHLLANKP